MITENEIYSATIQHQISAESITWNRFYNLLTGNSIFTVAWAAIFISAPHKIIVTLILAAICAFGLLLSVCFAALGYRGRRFVYEYNSFGQGLEKDIACYPASLANHRLFEMIANTREKLPYKWIGSFYLLSYAPLGFAGLYILLFIASLTR